MGRNPYNIGGNNHDNSGMIWDVVSVVVICLALALLYCFATSCGSVKEYVDREVEKEKIVYRDTTAWRDTTIYVPIPLGKDKAIVSIRDTSRLETSVAKSEAFVNEEGQICHTLENKRGNLSTVAKIPSRTIWTNVTSEKAHTVSKTVYRDTPMSWWANFRLKAFWPLLIAFLLMLAWTFRKFIF